MLELLTLEELDRDLFRGVNQATVPRASRLFGGQVAAQALRAAALTVDADRLPHSMHGYFLRMGTPDLPVILRVDRDRDGRSFSARRVVALQRGEVIFDLSASFHVREEGAEFVPASPTTPHPPEEYEADPWSAQHPFAEARAVPPTRPSPEGPHVASRMWTRVIERLPDDPVLHACALAYMSDFGSGYAVVDDPDLPAGGSSIDHSIWFHDAIRADEWTLLDMWPLKAGHARGLYAGSMHSASPDARGVLGLMFTQEFLMRVPRV